MPRRYDAKMFDIKHLRATAEKCKNWGKWGPNDEAGTLNYVTPQDIIDAGKLIKRGKAFVCDQTLEEIRRFSGRQEFSDDVCLLAVEVKQLKAGG